MSARLGGFVLERLSADAVTEAGVVRARIAGTASQREVAPLEELFAALHRACVGTEVQEVVVDLRDVEYMNSSHFKTIVSWVGRMAALERRVPVRLLANERYHWQRRSLQALRHLAEGVLTIE